MRYSDILVPTQDTIRSSYLIQMLLTNNNPVLCVGHTGTGKTMCTMDTLLRRIPVNYLSHTINFTAHTTVSQTQDFIDSKLERRSVTVAGPPPGNCSYYSSIFGITSSYLRIQLFYRKEMYLLHR